MHGLPPSLYAHQLLIICGESFELLGAPLLNVILLYVAKQPTMLPFSNSSRIKTYIKREYK